MLVENIKPNVQRITILEHDIMIYFLERIQGSGDMAIDFDVTVDFFVSYLEAWFSWQAYLNQHPDADELEKLGHK